MTDRNSYNGEQIIGDTLVMLSVAKHLMIEIIKKQKKILLPQKLERIEEEITENCR